MWSVARLWGKVLLCLVVIDIVLFHVGWLWPLKPNFGDDIRGLNWGLLYTLAGRFETRSTAIPTAFVVGSSVVYKGIHETLVAEALAQHHVPVETLRLTSFGANATDSALIVWNGMRLHPWLVIYGVASRDFSWQVLRNDPIERTFYDSSVDLAALPRVDLEVKLDATIKQYWKLYRYRFFARTALTTLLREGMDSIALAGPSPPEPLPPEADRRFGVYDMTAESYRIWQRWYQSRRVSDYLDWVQSRSAEVLRVYEGQTLAAYRPEGNRHVRSFEWMLRFLHRANVPTVVVYFPENPIFREPEAQRYFDPALSDTYAALLAREAVAYEARFVDLRNLLPPEDFYDLIHVNLDGMREVSARIAEIVEEEWQAHEAHAAPNQGQAAQ